MLCGKKKWRMQSKIPVSLLVEQKTGILAVFCTPLLERKIQKTLKKTKKLEQNCGYLSEPALHRKGMTGRIASPSAMKNKRKQSYVAFHSCGNLRCSRRREAAKRRTKTVQTGETCPEQNRIPESLLVEQKSGNFFVLSTPLIELPIQKTLTKAKKLEQNCGYLSEPALHRKGMTGRSAYPSAMKNPYYKSLRNNLSHKCPAKGVGNWPTPLS